MEVGFRSYCRTPEYPVKITIRRLLVYLPSDSPPPAPPATPPASDDESSEWSRKRHRQRHDRFQSDRRSDSKIKDSTPPSSPAAGVENATLVLSQSSPALLAVESGAVTAIRQPATRGDETWAPQHHAVAEAFTTDPPQRLLSKSPDPVPGMQCIEEEAAPLQPSAQRLPTTAFDAAALLQSAFESEATREDLETGFDPMRLEATSPDGPAPAHENHKSPEPIFEEEAHSSSNLPQHIGSTMDADVAHVLQPLEQQRMDGAASEARDHHELFLDSISIPLSNATRDLPIIPAPPVAPKKKTECTPSVVVDGLR